MASVPKACDLDPYQGFGGGLAFFLTGKVVFRAYVGFAGGEGRILILALPIFCRVAAPRRTQSAPRVDL